MADKKLQLKDLWPIGVVLAVTLVAMGFMTSAQVGAAWFMLFLSYGQNIGFTLSSRARNRNNMLYHMVAVLASTFVAFLTFRQIVFSQISLWMLPAYVAGTISGSLTGSYVSMWIERMTGAVADADPNAPQKGGNSKTVGLILLGVLVAAWGAQVLFFSVDNIWVLLFVTAAVFLPDMAYSMRTWVQNRNNDYLTLAVSLFNGLVDFLRYLLLIGSQMAWVVFVPYATGSTAGSVTGSTFGSWLGRKFKASADAHVKKGEMKKFNWNMIWLLAAMLVLGSLLFPVKNVWQAIPFFLSAVAMHTAFAIVSRARNRNNAVYHLIAAFCSNGIWYLVVHQIGIAKTDLALIVPYIVGTGLGALIGVRFAMWIEQQVGALADAFVPAKTQA